jgi:hypothetical protein
MKYFKNKNFNLIVFLTFVFLSFLASFNIFKKHFLNKGFNGDEYYLDNVYQLSKVNFEIITSIPSQFYLFLASILNIFIDNPKMSTRSVSFLVLFLVFSYFIIKLKSLKIDKFLKVQFFFILLFVVVFTKQCFVGTSDFLAIFFLIVFIIEINEVLFEHNSLSFKKIILLSLFLGLSIVTRPTVLVILLVYSITILFFFNKDLLRFKALFLIPLISIFFIAFFNFGALKNHGKIVLDVKEVPEDAGTSWLERNYLMAKFWDEGKIPNSQWLSSKDVVQYKKQNPDAYIPKSNLDLLFNEPKLYLKQMTRMFISANFTLLRYINVFYLFSFLILLIKYKPIRSFFVSNDTFDLNSFRKMKFILIVFYLSVFLFSFLAIKLFEFRWVIPVLIVLMWYVLISLINIKKEVSQLCLIIFYLSFTLGILKDYKIFLITE